MSRKTGHERGVRAEWKEAGFKRSFASNLILKLSPAADTEQMYLGKEH